MRIIGSIVIIALGVALGFLVVPVAISAKILSRSLWDRLIDKGDEQ